MRSANANDAANRADTVIGVVHDLEWLTTDLTSDEIIRAGVEVAQHATSSRIAYLHFLNADQNSVELGAWSQDTLAGCSVEHARHYPIAEAGVWADSARLREPCIHNDYEALPNRRGLPDGHSPLFRHLGLPVVDGGLVRMLIGVGNKPTDYDDADVEVLAMVARRIWSVIRQRRVLEHYLDVQTRFQHLQQLAGVCSLEYDVDDDVFRCDAMFSEVFVTSHPTVAPTNMHQFLTFFADDDRERVRSAMSAAGLRRQVRRVQCVRESGEPFPAELKVEFRPREIGQGPVALAILRDVSPDLMVDDLRRRADTDPLTGLPNRNRLDMMVKHDSERRTGAEGVAFHYIDLDGFKPVNDACGHLCGDEVLRLVAQRLRQSTRQEDVVVRMGGDEFAVVQSGVDGPAAALSLAEKIVAAISEPMVALGRTVSVGASVGIALSVGRGTRLRDLCADADRALSDAKALGGRRCVVAAAEQS